jgi:radical SAM superfamily enzyme YgiQ (UPF0313 family)
VDYIEMPDPGKVASLPEGFDLVAISSYSAQILEAYELARRYREAGVPVVLGGPHVSCLPDEASAHADAVVVGEGETAWPGVLEDLEAGRLGGVYGSREKGFDLGRSPMPAFELLDTERYNRLTVQTSRGCPHLCEFCAGSLLLAPRYRQKPVGRVLAEIDRILEVWKHPFLEFADDNSLVDRAYWKELLRALADRPLRWFAETDLSVSEDDELLRLMRRSGCAQVLVGLESPVRAGLEGLELRSDWKLRQWPRYREAIHRIQSRGIAVNGCFVIGLDGHGPDIFEQVFAFVEESDLYEVQITMQTPFPGTPLYDRLQREGRILEEGRWDRCTLFDLNYAPEGMSPEELVEGFRDLAVRLYSEEVTRRRRQKFRRLLRGIRDGSHEEVKA